MDGPSTSRALMDHVPLQYLGKAEPCDLGYEPVYQSESMEDDEYYRNLSAQTGGTNDGYDIQLESGDLYVQDVARRFAKRPEAMSASRKRHPHQSTAEAIKARLQKSICDLENLCCGVSYCGRSFSSLQVLAFHMSYAHSDLSSTSSLNAVCLVCGLELNSAKGKTVHLVSKHRMISAEHNSQCVRQREPVISPYAPAAIRLQYGVDERDFEEEYGPNDDLNVSFLDLAHEHGSYQ